MRRSQKIKNLVILLVVGLAIILYCNRGLSKARTSVSWPSTKGKIITSTMQDALLMASYEYEVNGKTYTSQRVSFLSNYISKEERSRIRMTYPAGQTADVFYNPDMPGESTLIAGAHKYNENPFSFLGTILFWIGLAGLFVYGISYFREGNDLPLSFAIRRTEMDDRVPR
jgi:hypothetical protein